MIMKTSSKDKLRIINIVGARPNFMKIAPLMAEYHKFPEIEAVLVHTGQHYDKKMSHLFFDQLEIPKPKVNLEVGSASQALQTAEIIRRFEPVVLKYQPDLVLVVGDVNSTIACALVAVKLGVKVAHVEAGLRSFDRQMPEEINRLLTDAISDFLFVSEPSGLENLRREGIPAEKIFFVGNVMIDTLQRNLAKAEQSQIIEDLGLHEKSYAIITLHRPANVDDPIILQNFLHVLTLIGDQIPIIFPVHPRTRATLAKCDNFDNVRVIDRATTIGSKRGIFITEPMGYLDFLKLMAHAKIVLTDSGGIQEETTILKVPCLTLRENTERPITVEVGTNTIASTDPESILKAFQHVMSDRKKQFKIPELWDGYTASRIVKILLGSYKNS